MASESSPRDEGGEALHAHLLGAHRESNGGGGYDHHNGRASIGGGHAAGAYTSGSGSAAALPPTHVTNNGLESFDYEPVSNQVVSDELRQRAVAAQGIGGRRRQGLALVICSVQR